MSAPQLGIDPEDLGYNILPAIEQSFGIKFTDDDFHLNFTYGELRALVLARLPQTPVADCTTQQAFYKVRQALRPLVGAADIRPDSQLVDLLPTDPRPAVAALEAALGRRLRMLRMPTWAEFGGAGLLILSLVLFFFDWPLALALLGLSVLGLDVAHRLGRTLRFATIRQLVEHIGSYHYRQARRNPATVNLREIDSQLAQLLIDWEGLEPDKLVPEAIL